MAGETRNKPTGSVNPGRSGYDRNKRGRGDFSRGDTRGSRGSRGREFRGTSRRGNDLYSSGFVARNSVGTYIPSKQNYSRENAENFRQNSHVAKFDGNTLSDLNEFPDFNHCDPSNGSRNMRKSDNKNLRNGGEVKSLNWNGKEQAVFLSSRGSDQSHSDGRNYIRVQSNDPQRIDDRIADSPQSRSSRGMNTPGYGRSPGRHFQRRSSDNSRRVNIRTNIPSNSLPVNYDDPRMMPPPPPHIDLLTLFTNSRFVSPPSMEGYECMPGDSPHDHDESNFYKVKVNDDTLDPVTRIVYQLEFYFSNFNLKTDSFLRDQMDFNGYVAFDTIVKFPRIMRLKATKIDLIEAVNMSNKLECDTTVEMVRRSHSPDKWTNTGLFNECARVYNSYIYDTNFPDWYSRAQEYMKSFPTESQKPGPFSDIAPMNMSFLPMNVDPKTGNMLPPFLVPYSGYMGFPTMEMMGTPDMDMAMHQFHMMSYDVDPMSPQPRPERCLSPESYDPTANEMFKEMVSSRAVNEDSHEVHSELDTEHVNIKEESCQDSTQPTVTVENVVPVEPDDILINPKELRNFRISSKPKPHPVKHDRHSHMQNKNAKVEAQRDVVKQVELGIRSYEHEQYKKSTSTHGALSQNPEAPSKVFVADVTKIASGSKEEQPHFPTVVDGDRIVTNKKVIEEACDKYNKGMQEPIPISKQDHHSTTVNGVKDATASNKNVRKDNKKQSGGKGKKGLGGNPPRAPQK